MTRILRDSLQEEAFQRNGYLKTALLSDKDIRAILEIYKKKEVRDFNSYSERPKHEPLSFEDLREIREKAAPILAAQLDHIFSDYQIVFIEFLPKGAKKSYIPGHQDWLFTDNDLEHTPSISCFIALTDVTMENGPLGFIKGSHLIKDLVPPPSPAPIAPLPLIQHSYLIFKYLDYQELKAGEMIIFYNNTIHGSLNNLTNQDRIVIRIALTKKSARLVHYYLFPDQQRNSIIKYQVDQDFYIKYRNERITRLYESGQLLDEYTELEKLTYQYPAYTTKQLEKIFVSLGNTPTVHHRYLPEAEEKNDWKNRLLRLFRRNNR